MYAGEKQYGFEEILPIYKAVSSESDTGTFADFMEAFKTYDREGQGFINAAELRHVLCSLGMTRPVVTHCTRSVVSLCLSVCLLVRQLHESVHIYDREEQGFNAAEPGTTKSLTS